MLFTFFVVVRVAHWLCVFIVECGGGGGGAAVASTQPRTTRGGVDVNLFIFFSVFSSSIVYISYVFKPLYFVKHMMMM
jgi:hypothetical protein